MARFMRKGITKFHFVPTIASATKAPTVAEVTAGEYIGDQLAEVAGFNFSNNPIQTPDMDSSYVSQVPGEDTTDDSSLTFYEDKIDNPISDLLEKGTLGYVVIFYQGYAGATPAAGDLVDVWPVEVSSNNRTYTVANEAAQYLVSFAVNDQPANAIAVLT